MGTRVAVMNAGHIEQVGTPQEVYDAPASVFVATFIGMPPMNVLPAGTFESGDHLVGMRPEHVTIGAAGPVAGIVRLIEQLGHETLVVCDVGAARVTVRQAADAAVPTVGTEVQLDSPLRHRHRFDSTTLRRIDI